VNRELQKLLNVGSFSHGNPFIARAGLYIAPIVGLALSFLSVFRASFNIWTWRDPFLSFWFSIFGILLAFILFIFPWRLFFFVLGIVLVGPQNFFIRLLRERRDTLSKSKKVIDGTTAEVKNKDQPLFQSHPPINRRYHELDTTKINPQKVHHIVVPYSPLMYSSRMYDWPPEPEYASVKHRHPMRNSHLSSNSISNNSGQFDFNGTNSVSSASRSLNSHLRRRTDSEENRRRTNSEDNVPPVIDTSEDGRSRKNNKKKGHKKRTTTSSPSAEDNDFPMVQPMSYPKSTKWE